MSIEISELRKFYRQFQKLAFSVACQRDNRIYTFSDPSIFDSISKNLVFCSLLLYIAARYKHKNLVFCSLLLYIAARYKHKNFKEMHPSNYTYQRKNEDDTSFVESVETRFPYLYKEVLTEPLVFKIFQYSETWNIALKFCYFFYNYA